MKSATTNRKRISPQESLALWQEYKRSGDVQARNRLVMTSAPLFKYIVFKKVRELPARCEVEDFISCGLEALIASIDRFDPSKGATLEQFAWTRWPATTAGSTPSRPPRPRTPRSASAARSTRCPSESARLPSCSTSGT